MSDSISVLFRLSDAGGNMEFNEIASGKSVNKSLFNSDDGKTKSYFHQADFL